MDVEELNARWLKAWSDKDVPALLAIYHPEVVYRDPQVPAGVQGSAALGAYLSGLFAATPPMTYVPDTVWPTATGWCGRWYCAFEVPGAGRRRLRGFDLVELRDGRIALNEVYTHELPPEG